MKEEGLPLGSPKLAALLGLIAATLLAAPSAHCAGSALFPTDLPAKEWVQFRAEGFSRPVTGVVYLSKDSVSCGMPLGGVDTGCIDLETSGLLGYRTIFNTHAPRGGPINLPVLGLSVGGKTWVLCAKRPKPAADLSPPQFNLKFFHPVEPTFMDLRLDGVETAKEVHYWGHYPVADLEFDTDAPVTVGVRAWNPFFPGDVVDSMIPGMVFEVHLRNATDSTQRGAVAFSFSGPTEKEAGTGTFERQVIKGGLSGVAVNGKLGSYAMGVVGTKARLGGELGADGATWAKIAQALPAVEPSKSGSSAAVDFSMGPRKSTVVRFVVTWCAPTWNGGGYNWATTAEWHKMPGNTFTHMYAKYYPSPVETARLLAKEHRALLKRILAWQEAVYTDKSTPGWLQDVLVNNFHLITELGMWAQAKPPIGKWCRPEDGIFALNENPRGCPQMECGGNSYLGGMTLMYAFPELVLSTLRTYKAYQYPNGAPEWIFGGCTGQTPPCELTMPSLGYCTGQTGSYYTGMVSRYYRMTGDEKFLHEFYPFVKKLTLYTFNLNPRRPYGLISLPVFDQTDAFESIPTKGMASHVASLRLYHLKAAEFMARKDGDIKFAEQCKQWYDESWQLMEEHLWTGSYYRQHKEIAEDGKVNIADVVMAYQLDGQFMSKFDGIEESFTPERVKTTLATLKKTIEPWGPRVWTNPDGSTIRKEQFDTGYWTPHGVHVPCALWLADTYMYEGEKEFGIELARKMMFNMVCRQGWAWDMPILYRGDTGEGIWGNDYNQMMAVWTLPAAIAGTDLSGICKPGGLMYKMRRAAGGKK